MKSIEEKKLKIIYEVFVDTADKDYLIARLLYLNGMHRQFFWSACQAIEKYIKAILVINNLSALKYGHNIEKSFKALTPFIKIKSNFIIPAQIKLFNEYPDLWGDNRIEEFIKHINQSGNPDNRYDTYSTFSDFSDLYKLDQTVSLLKSHCPEAGWSDEFIKQMKSSKLMFQALCDNNFSFFPDYKHSEIKHSSKGHVTELEILFKNNVLGYQELRRWVELNIYRKVDLLK